MSRDTIFALSSGQPPAAIAIVRISGPHAAFAMSALAGKTYPERVAKLATLRDPSTGILLDRALVLFFSGPNSATGEDLVELHLHGGRAVVAAVQRSLVAVQGLRSAQPGEFTRRAFDNGRLDLAEAEGLADLLNAETEGQRRNAIALADGVLSRSVRGWREAITMIAAQIEARIDFSDEDDVPDDEGMAIQAIRPILTEIDDMLRAPPAERLRDGIRVVLGGGPNTGKSTLFNALVGREAAIATPMPGTTRDMIEYPVQLDGVPFVFVDTAGLRESDDEIEQMGMSRARSAMSAADIVLWLDSPEKCSEPDRVLMVHARCDLPDRDVPPPGCIGVSAKTGTGMFELIANIVSRGTMLLPKDNELALVARQRDALHDCAASLRAMEHSSDILITAECLREARAALDRLTGHAGVEPLLDALFSRFCIGK